MAAADSHEGSDYEMIPLRGVQGPGDDALSSQYIGNQNGNG